MNCIILETKIEDNSVIKSMTISYTPTPKWTFSPLQTINSNQITTYITQVESDGAVFISKIIHIHVLDVTILDNKLNIIVLLTIFVQITLQVIYHIIRDSVLLAPLSSKIQCNIKTMIFTWVFTTSRRKNLYLKHLITRITLSRNFYCSHVAMIFLTPV
jgi:hypothetical protein